MSESKPFALIVGCGYVGQRLARALSANREVLGVVRTQASCEQLQAQGIHAIVLDLDAPPSELPLPADRVEQSWLFYLAPPPATGVSDARLDKFLRRLRGRPDAFVYMSTTGVYGDTAGAFVDESSVVQPRTDRARRRISAEEMTRVWCNERRVRRVVLRVPGIYGPDRLPLERLRHFEPVVREREAGINNRIHVDDLVEACTRAITNAEARGVYNVTDGRPLSSTTFINLVAKVAGLPPPPQVSMEEAQLTFSPERLSFLNESRRVSNERMLKHLGVVLKYSDVEAGIRASLK
jgi:nucleoside-diphosphate-sugar epimerase